MEMILPNQSKGHYTPAIKSNGMLYISGQLPMNEQGQITGDIVAQTRQALANLETVLQAAKCQKNQVVQCRVYLSDIANWDIVNQLYADFFSDHKPARTIVPCGNLHYHALIEIDAIAELL